MSIMQEMLECLKDPFISSVLIYLRIESYFSAFH